MAKTILPNNHPPQREPGWHIASESIEDMPCGFVGKKEQQAQKVQLGNWEMENWCAEDVRR